MRILIGYAAGFAAALASGAPDDRLGRVLDPVLCVADPEQSYALYVPSYYSSREKWPVIFCFDAGARGLIPVERLQAAAEKYGYIVAGSLTSRNGPWAANARAAEAMIRDVSAHFSVDPRRVYTAGMSGGARVATAIALAGTARGVIACGAGFPVQPDGIPRRVPFFFFGTVGTEDFNYAELRRLEWDLEERGAAHRIMEFDGGHEWASAALLAGAVEWLELQAMQTGARPKAAAFIESELQARLLALPAQPGLARWRALKSLAGDFNGLADTQAFERQARALGASREVKADRKAERALAAREEELLQDLGAGALESPRRQRNRAAAIARLADQPEDSAERRMVRRVRAGFVSMARETVRDLFEQADYGKAAGFLEMAEALRPGQPKTLFDLARAYAAHGDRANALDALERAATAGFADAARLEAEPAFAPLRDDPGFAKSRARIASGPAVALPAMRVSAALASVELRPFYRTNAGGAGLPLSFLRVERVGPNTAAALAGLEAGMEVTSIQGARIRGLTEEDLEKTMTLPVRDEIVLTVREPPLTKEREIHIAARKPGPPPEAAGSFK